MQLSRGLSRFFDHKSFYPEILEEAKLYVGITKTDLTKYEKRSLKCFPSVLFMFLEAYTSSKDRNKLSKF